MVFVAVFAFVFVGSAFVIVMREASERVRDKVRTLATEHAAGIAFVGYIYRFRFESIRARTHRYPGLRPFALLADSAGIQIYGPWRKRLRREIKWSAVAHVKFDILQARGYSVDGLKVIGVSEGDCIDIKPGVPDLFDLIRDLEALRAGSPRIAT